METVPGQWCEDSAALAAALAELDWVTEDDLLGEDEASCGPVLPDGAALPLQEPSAGAGDWSVPETLARVAACPPGPQPIRWLTCLDGRQLSPGEALEVAGAWERQARWVTARQQASWVGFLGPTGPGPLGPDGPTEAQLRAEHSNLLELALTIDCGLDFTRDQVDQARLLAGTLSATRDRLAGGELSAYRARRIAQELRTLDPGTARDIETRVLGTAGTVRVPSLIRKLRRLVLAAQGPAAVQAHQAGQPNAGSSSTPKPPRSDCSGCTPTCPRSRPSPSGNCSRPKPPSWPAPTGPPASRSNAATSNAPNGSPPATT